MSQNADYLRQQVQDALYMFFTGLPTTAPKSDPGASRKNAPDLASKPTPAPLNISAVLAAAETEPEQNPRDAGNTEATAYLYREVARIGGRMSLLEQKV